MRPLNGVFPGLDASNLCRNTPESSVWTGLFCRPYEQLEPAALTHGIGRGTKLGVPGGGDNPAASLAYVR